MMEGPEADGAEVLAQLEAGGKITVDLPDGEVTLDSDDVQVRVQAKEGWAAAQGRSCVVVLATELTEALLREGLARELVHAVQNRRRDMKCRYTDRIEVGVATESEELRAALRGNSDYINGETLSVKLVLEPLPEVEPADLKLSGHELTLYVRVIPTE